MAIEARRPHKTSVLFSEEKACSSEAGLDCGCQWQLLSPGGKGITEAGISRTSPALIREGTILASGSTGHVTSMVEADTLDCVILALLWFLFSVLSLLGRSVYREIAYWFYGLKYSCSHRP